MTALHLLFSACLQRAKPWKGWVTSLYYFWQPASRYFSILQMIDKMFEASQLVRDGGGIQAQICQVQSTSCTPIDYLENKPKSTRREVSKWFQLLTLIVITTGNGAQRARAGHKPPALFDSRLFWNSRHIPTSLGLSFLNSTMRLLVPSYWGIVVLRKRAWVKEPENF